MQHQPHKSTLSNLDANIVALGVYLIPFLLSILSSNFKYIVWIIPLIAYLYEKDSDFVIYHASQALAFNVMTAIFWVISSVLGIVGVTSTILFGIPLIGFAAAGAIGILYVIVGIILGIISVILFVYEIICMFKAYQYYENYVPIVTKIALIIMKARN